ncbi:MAG TPA: PQQ-binding-like beta-propeller repeat protein, partial [Gemmataceae bacterium]|nr:PQQ-binding-like beta-propeller repeat protein [Gemmataceae bacterium]
RFVFVVHVTKLYAFYRHSGVVEFVHELDTAATTGPACDETTVYVVLAIRPASGGAHRVAALKLPAPVSMANVTVVEGGKPTTLTPVESLTNRYPTTGVPQTNSTVTFERSRGSLEVVPTGGLSSSRSPSLAVTPSVSPPYSLDIAPRTPALSTINSMRQPYTLRGENAVNIQHTPSLSTIPPSVAAALALSDLRPKGVAPRTQWELGTTNRVLYQPLVTPRRVWGASDGRMVVALSKFDGNRDLDISIPAQVAAPPAQAETTGYFPVGDGNLYAIDLLGGDKVGGLNQLWRANVGGLMNHAPFVTADGVFAAGDDGGVARIERATGVITWKSDNSADRVIAANHEFVYLRDRQGRFLVYDAKRATDPQNRFSLPLSGISLPEFNVPIVNTVTDRVYLAADNGLIVCLRDASVKYRNPVRIAPAAVRDPVGTKADPKAADPKTIDPKAADPKAADPKMGDPAVDPKKP